MVYSWYLLSFIFGGAVYLNIMSNLNESHLHKITKVILLFFNESLCNNLEVTLKPGSAKSDAAVHLLPHFVGWKLKSWKFEW